MTMTILRPHLAMLLLLCLAACAGLGARPSPPRVSLADIRVQEIKLFETVFQVQMRVFNTSDSALAIEGIEADLDLNGKPFARGVGRSRITIPPFGTELVTLDVYSSAMNMVALLLEAMKERRTSQDTLDRFGYRLQGRLHLGRTGRISALPFASEGNLGAGLNQPGGSLSPLW